MSDERGSIWRKWDLHVHTPASLVHHYPGNEGEAWEAFVTDLECLPPEFAVIGVNDYIFLDGYKRLLEYRKKGRLANIATLFPVVELRVDRFGGTGGALSRLNYHIIFSDELEVETIESQFLAALAPSYRLVPEYQGTEGNWSGAVTKQSLADFGSKIRASTPAGKRLNLGSDLELGFNSLNVNLDAISGILKRSYFSGKCLTAIGKSEWESIRWTNSVADKRHVVNSVSFVFAASKDADAFFSARKSLDDQGVNSQLLHCSDAHYPSNSTQSNRVGNCLLWIKADTTFGGLRLAATEYLERAFVGEKPPKLVHLEANATKYIASVTIQKTSASTLQENWFSALIPSNPGLIAIIGSKGSGKSALADVLGLLGESRQEKYFSFLRDKRFRDARFNRASHFEASIKWASGMSVTKQLSDSIDEGREETIRYLPQTYLESVCSEVSPEAEQFFDRELKSVIYSHVPTASRFGRETLNELLDYKLAENQQAAEARRAELAEIHRQIVTLQKQWTKSHRERLRNALEQREAELKAHDATRPPVVPIPESDVAGREQEDEVRTLVDQLLLARSTAEMDLNQTVARLEASTLNVQLATKALAKIANFEVDVARFRRELDVDLAGLGLKSHAVVRVDISADQIREIMLTSEAARSAAEAELDATNVESLAGQLQSLDFKLGDLRAKLDQPNRAYQEYVAQFRTWEQRRAELVGATDRPGTVEHARASLAALNAISEKLKDLLFKRKTKVFELYRGFDEAMKIYRELYRPVQDFIRDHPLARDKLDLRFDVAVVERNFVDLFFDIVSRSSAGPFRGTVEGAKALSDIVAANDLATVEGMWNLVEGVVTALCGGAEDQMDAVEKMESHLRRGKTVEDVYGFLFGLTYIFPRYVLKLGERELAQLSPGEKGALLLVFFLLVDTGEIPLVIDQPEENLDNQTVYSLLVPSIKQARRRRQVFVVTHNPNLAVVCDADQVIYASIDRASGNRITYQSGAIENPIIRARIIDVLEGTRPAFENRERKYAIT